MDHNMAVYKLRHLNLLIEQKAFIFQTNMDKVVTEEEGFGRNSQAQFSTFFQNSSILSLNQ